MVFPFKLQLKNLGPHKDVLLSDNVSTLKSVIFAKNGQGKSFISKAFQLLENEKPPETASHLIRFSEERAELSMSINDQNVSVCVEKNNTPVIQKNTNCIFYVFNSEYVQKNIEKRKYRPTENRGGYILGKVNIDLNNERNELQELIKERENYVESKKKEIAWKLEEYSKEFKLANLKKFKEMRSLNIEAMDAEPDFDKSAFETEVTSFKKLSTLPEDISDIPVGIRIDNQFDTTEIEQICNKKIYHSSYSEEAISVFIKDNSDFILKGLAVYEKEGSKCPYCKQKLSDEAQKIIKFYEEFKNSEEKRALQICEKNISFFDEMLIKTSKLDEEIQNQSERFKHIQSYFDENETLENLMIARNVNKLIKKIKEKIEHKKNHLDVPFDIQIDVVKLKKIFHHFNEILENNDKKIKALNQKKEKASGCLRDIKEKIIFHIRKELFSENVIKVLEYKDKISRKSEDIIKRESEQKILKSTCILDTLRKNISYFFNKKYEITDDFSIKFFEKDITENIENVLSDGEKTILSFCYYLSEIYAKIKNKDDLQNMFFIIDDPISSLDEDYMYGIVQIIRNLNNLFENYLGKIERLRYILLTHNFYFLSTLCRNKIVDNVYILREGSISTFDRQIFQMPYFSHLQDIYNVSQGATPSHTTSNSLRQVVEGLKTILAPKDSLEVFVASMLNCSSLYSAVSDGSHGGFFFKEFSDRELSDLSKELIEYIQQSPLKKHLEYFINN